MERGASNRIRLEAMYFRLLQYILSSHEANNSFDVSLTFGYLVPTSNKTMDVSRFKTKRLVLFKEIISVNCRLL